MRKPFDRKLTRAKRRAALATAATAAAAMACAALTAPMAYAEAACPNSAFRTGYAAKLPDCRAYEVVSPPGSQPYFENFSIGSGIGNVSIGAPILGEAHGAFAAESGGAFSFFSSFAPAGSLTDGPDYLSMRGGLGWATQGIIPPQSAESTPGCLPYMVGWSSSFEKGVLADGYNKPGAGSRERCGADEPLLVAGEPRGNRQNLFVRDNRTGSYQLVDVTPPGVTPANAEFEAASRDLSKVVFDEQAALAQGGAGEVYEWSGSSVHLVTVLPDGTPVDGELVDRVGVAGVTSAETLYVSPGSRYAVSADGSRVDFTFGGRLYVRENPDQPESAVVGGVCSEPAKACTVQVDASQAAGSGGGGQFMGASADGSQIFFTDADSAELTAGTVPGSGQNLYRFDVATGSLTDLTPVAKADVEGVSGLGEDGSDVYFIAKGVLAPNAVEEQPNLYVLRNGETKLIATLDPSGDSCDWELDCMTARVSRNGAYLAFDSVLPLTGYDNKGGPEVPCQNEACQEVYLYSASTGLVCASCNPTGAPPTGPSSIVKPITQFSVGNSASHLQRNVSDTGQVFFTSFDSLPGAIDGEANAYEFESGHLYLLSSGTSAGPSFFYEASADGQDVFILTAQHLTTDGSEGEYAVVDARVDGGFPAPAAPLPPCSAESECRPPATGAPPVPVFGSTSSGGAGNLVVPPSRAAVPPRTPAQVRAGKLAHALKACRARGRRKRKACEATARKRYGVHKRKAVSGRSTRGKK